MKLSLIIVGKTDFPFIEEGIKLYTERIKRYCPFQISLIKNYKEAGRQANIIKIKEGENILSIVKSTDYLVLLDEKGKTYSSVQFAKFVESKQNTGMKHMIFVIGGAYGFSDDVYTRANEKVSLSQMTFSHQVVRLLFLEQLYRAFTINNNEPYHHN
jgi:23S rRNA (pseudouridine1915-N3)-methyltransferase